MKIKTDQKIIHRITKRGVEEIMPSAEKLEKLLKSGKRLNVYQGFDPTAPTLHIGHAIGMRKLRDFQILGHNVIFLFGDFTARIGDPTDKTSARKQLTNEQVKKNLKGYKEQANKILDFDNKDNPIQIKFNSSWHDKMTFEQVIELAAEFTVQQMIKRSMFQERLKNDHPIYIHEFFYPMMQGYDSIAMDIDVEVGGNDQAFNMLAGRDLVSKKLKKEKFVLPVKLLTDPSGKKMGKSEGNMIMLSDSATNMYGKAMAFSDEQITLAYELLTDIPMDKIKQMQKDMKSSKVNPMELKKRLAFMITKEHKGEKSAKQAQEHFEKIYQQKSTKSDQIPEKNINQNKIRLIDAIVKHAKFAQSNSEAKRLIKQGAVSLDNKKVSNKNKTITLTKGQLITLRVGRKIINLFYK